MASYDDLAVLIDRVARNVAKDYPDIDWEDVRQELCVFVLSHGSSIKLKHEGGNPKWLLERVAQTYCKNVRTQHLILSAQYAYKPSDVKKILETAFFPERVSETHIPDDAVSLDGIDDIQISSDVMAAYAKLKPELQAALFRRYALNQIPGNETYDRKKLNRAVNELTYRLNQYRGIDQDRRRVLSNSGARAAITEVYDGS
jgi:DNA-directed RNA polymerase specialized sigma24 family protein